LKESHHILVVDDEDLNRQLTKLHLNQKGCQISEAASGTEALEIIQDNQLDLILLDIEMPGMNGLEVLSQLRLKYSPLQLPVIMVTANDNEHDIINAFHLGANDYLLKPLNYEIAEARIRTQLSQSYLSNLKDSFLQFAKHDLKKPLLLIQDISDELKRTLTTKYSIDDDTQSLLDLILKATSNTQEMINGFLDENNQKNNHVLNNQLVDINSVIENLCSMNEKYATKKNITLKTIFKKIEHPIYSDIFRITQIIDNLMGNAIKFSPENTLVKIQTELDKNKLTVEIKDQGPGIAEDEFDLLFKKHAKLSNKPTGNENSSGIGLALCHELARQINVNIGARNNPEGGATFYLEKTLND